MSTRSIIAVETETGGIKGVYCHSDGYPSGVGQKLYDLAQLGDLETLIDFLIESNPEGWSQILEWDGDPANIMGYDEHEGRMRPHITNGDFDTAYACVRGCAVYYDGVRVPDDPMFFDLKTAADSWAEYLSTFNGERRTLTISHTQPGGVTVFGFIDLNGDDPDWDALDNR